jgi:hypothetical protein
VNIGAGVPNFGPFGQRPAEYRVGTDWHTYRLEARGNNLKLFIDGALRMEMTDNQHLSSGRVGLFSWYSAQINVRSFKVIAV